MSELENTTAVRVLLLEDSSLDAELVLARLKKTALTFEVTRAYDRASFFENLEARAYDLILADYALPDFDGLLALQATRRLFPNVPFIFISGRVGEEVAIETLQRGATDYVLKQRLERLVPAVTRALKEAAEHAERKRVERQFQQSETRFREVIDALPQRVWLAGEENTLIYTNKAWEAAALEGTQDWLGEGLVHPDERRECEQAWASALASQKAFSCEARLWHAPDSSWRWHLIRMAPLFGTRNGEQTPRMDWLGIATDLQEQKLNEEALRTAEKLAVTGRMMAGIAHEINNPLESVSNLIFLVRIESKENPRVLEYLDITENELKRVAAITKQTLQFYRDPLTPTQVDAREILEDVLRLFATRLASKQIDQQLDVRVQILFEAIRGEIRQVLINLVGNAIDAVSSGGKIHVAAEIVREAEREMVKIRIEDNGVGLAATKVERLFQPFFSTKGAHGTGLGLWVSKGIVEKHEGSITLRSDRTGGDNATTATVMLPLHARQQLAGQGEPA